MSFLIFLAVVAVAYFAWRIVDQLPDVLYRLSEIQRDVAELRRRFADQETSANAETATRREREEQKPAAQKTSKADSALQKEKEETP